MQLKQVTKIISSDEKHWVGDAFFVSTMFSYQHNPEQHSPFLLLDYASKQHFEPNHTNSLRGVGKHPHKGFETVTIAYAGEVEHGDNAGNSGLIAAGDVQWMTAGKGIIHQEFHGKEFSKLGGDFEMVQLWVNLPKAHKLTAPKYQSIQNKDIPIIKLANNGYIRVIAGQYDGIVGKASTFSPINLFDIQLNATTDIQLKIEDNFNTMLLCLNGDLTINHQINLSAKQLAYFAIENNIIHLQALTDCRLLLLSGEIIDEPVVGYGPFVMNTMQEIKEAIDDYNHQRF